MLEQCAVFVVQVCEQIKLGVLKKMVYERVKGIMCVW